MKIHLREICTDTADNVMVGTVSFLEIARLKKLSVNFWQDVDALYLK